jgi:hypothetical protein
MDQIYQKIVGDALAAQRASLSIIENGRVAGFSLGSLEPFLDFVAGMRAAEDQSQSVIQLHSKSAEAHHRIFKAMSSSIRPEDEPFISCCQAPAVLEILYDEDPRFKKSAEAFTDALGKSESLIGIEAMNRYARDRGTAESEVSGSGSSLAMCDQVMKTVEMPEYHRQPLLMAMLLSLIASCGIGVAFSQAMRGGASISSALESEAEALKLISERPIEAQAELLASAGLESFDPWGYMSEYRKRIEGSVRDAVDDGVNYYNILAIPVYAVGDISRLSQSTFNLAKDDVVMAIIGAVTEVIESSLRGSLRQFKSPDQPLVLATGSAACALEYILELDGFDAIDVVNLLTRGRRGCTAICPAEGTSGISGTLSDFHDLSFIDLIYNGWRYLDNTARKGKAFSSKGVPVPKVTWFDVDLEPILESEVLMNPRRYTNPAHPALARFSAMMRLSDNSCLLNGAATSISVTNIAAVHKEVPISPAEIYKSYVMGKLEDSRYGFCPRTASA